jgi:Glucose / Sorbosone dehydrogenase
VEHDDRVDDSHGGTIRASTPAPQFGTEYAGGPIGRELASRADMEPAATLYTGSAFPAWRDNLFGSGMVAKSPLRFVVKGNRIVSEEGLFASQGWCVRNVVQGPDGLLYVGVDGGMILRIAPEKQQVAAHGARERKSLRRERALRIRMNGDHPTVSPAFEDVEPRRLESKGLSGPG